MLYCWPRSVHLGFDVATSCGVVCRCSSDPVLLWLWHRLAAAAQTGLLAQELPYAAVKRKKKLCESRKVKMDRAGALPLNLKHKWEPCVRPFVERIFITAKEKKKKGNNTNSHQWNGKRNSNHVQQWVSDFNVHQNFQERLIPHGISDSGSRSGRDPRICLSNKASGDSDAAALGTHLDKLGSRAMRISELLLQGWASPAASWLTEDAKKIYRIISSYKVQNWETLNLMYLFIYLCLFRVSPTAYGGSQGRGQIGAAAASLRQGYSNKGSQPRLWPTPQLTAMLDS